MVALGSEQELENALWNNWWNIRDSFLGDSFAIRPNWESEPGDEWLFRNNCYRQVALPGSAQDRKGTGYVDLLEVRVTIARDLKSSTWSTIVDITVIELKNVALTAAHLAQLMRYVSSIRWLILSSEKLRGLKINTAGALLGRSVPDDLTDIAEPIRDLHVGSFDLDFVDGFHADWDPGAHRRDNCRDAVRGTDRGQSVAMERRILGSTPWGSD